MKVKNQINLLFKNALPLMIICTLLKDFLKIDVILLTYRFIE